MERKSLAWTPPANMNIWIWTPPLQYADTVNKHSWQAFEKKRVASLTNIAQSFFQPIIEDLHQYRLTRKLVLQVSLTSHIKETERFAQNLSLKLEKSSSCEPRFLDFFCRGPSRTITHKKSRFIYTYYSLTCLLAYWLYYYLPYFLAQLYFLIYTFTSSLTY